MGQRKVREVTSPEWCDTCSNTGEILCLCGGTQCACGEIKHCCPDCTDDYDDARGFFDIEDQINFSRE